MKYIFIFLCFFFSNSILVEHSFDGEVWEKRGEIDNKKFYPESAFWNHEKLKDSEFYYVRFSSDERIFFQKRYPKCNIIDSGFKETVTIFGKPVVDVDHSLKKVKNPTQRKCKMKGKKIKQNVLIKSESETIGKKVSIRGYKGKIDTANNVDNRGFLAKYWKYILFGFIGLALFSVIAGGGMK